MTKTRADSFRTFLDDLSKELFQSAGVTERALILADTVSYEIWGGARGWERATEEQFQTLVRRLKELLRDGTENRTAAPEDGPQDEACCKEGTDGG